MKIKKTTYNSKKTISRGKLANPFDNSTIRERLLSSKAIDLSKNVVWKEDRNGYIESHIIDRNKLMK